MISRKLNLFLRLSPHRTLMQLILQNSTIAYNKVVGLERNPAKFFFNEDVQNILKILIRPVPEKVFRRRLDSSKIQEPEYKFMTDEQLQEALAVSQKKMNTLLQIPPYIKVREDNVRVLSNDPAITGYSTCKHVFTDITYGVSNKNRIIVVREPNGILRTANYEERDRLNQIYFPIAGREIEIPKMFEDEHLKPILDREDYEFVLNRACIQFDPDHPLYHKIMKKTFDDVNTKLKFDKLRSTRHYGSLVFHLVWTKNINNLLLENIMTQKIEDAALLIKLYYILNEIEVYLEDKSDIELIDDFIHENKSVALPIKEAFRSYCFMMKEKENIQKEINS